MVYMRLEDIFLMPQGMGVEEYEKKLKDLDRIGRKISRLSDKRYDLEDSLSILQDEKDDERYVQKEKDLDAVLADLQTHIEKYNKLAGELGRRKISG